MKTRSASFDPEWADPARRFGVYKVTLARRYWNGSAFVLESPQTLDNAFDVAHIGPITQKGDTPIESEFLNSNVTIKLRNKGWAWLPANTTDGLWRLDSTALSGYIPFGSEVQIYYGFNEASGDEALAIFTGFVDDLVFDSESGAVQVSLVGREYLLQNSDATKCSTALNAQAALPITFNVTTGANDTIDFNIGGGALVATVSAGAYPPGVNQQDSGVTLCAAIAKALAAADPSGTYTVSYNAGTSIFTIARSAGTFQMKFATGPNTAKTIAPLLRFAVADQTGALSYSGSAETVANGGSLTFSTGTPSLWRIRNVYVGGVAAVLGASNDYTISNIGDPINPALIVFNAGRAPAAGAGAVTWDGDQWLLNNSIGTLVGLLCDTAGIDSSHRSIDEPIFPGGASSSKTIDSEADWEAGTVLGGFDTTTSPGDLLLKGSTSYAYSGGTVSYVVPAGVTSIYIDMKGPGGGGGGGGDSSSSGSGGGGGGGGATNGGSGAGAGGAAGSNSYVKRGASTLAQAAIGAGGAGGYESFYSIPGGAGGSAGSDVASGLTTIAGGGGAGGPGGQEGHGGGGIANGVSGSAGDRVTGYIAVTPGETLTLMVGGGGGGGGAASGSPGGAGTNGSMTIWVASANYESAVFDCLSTPSAWGAISSYQTLNGGTIAYYTASSTDGITFDAWVAVNGSNVIQSALKRYFKIRAVVTLGGFVVFPILSKIVAAFTTLTLFIAAADFSGMTCADAINTLAIMGGMEWGTKGDGTLFFRAKTVVSGFDIDLDESGAVVKVESYDLGYKEISNVGQVNYGGAISTKDAASESEAAPTSEATYGRIVYQLSLGNFLYSNSAQVADAIARKLYLDNYRPKKKITATIRIAPQIDTADRVRFSFYDGDLLRANILGDKAQKGFPASATPMNVLARKLIMKVVGATHDVMNGTTQLNLEEILS